MLPNTSDPFRIALNRVTFGARDLDVQSVKSTGWSYWVNAQLSPPDGDDAGLATYLKAQLLHIKYAAPTATQTKGTWTAVDEDRGLNYLSADTAKLWDIARNNGTTYASYESVRIRQELAAATWIRNTHSSYQLREFMVDFWHNHFNIGKNENELATALLPVYDRTVIRPNAFGNFRALLEATATASSMLIYLDNWVSTATTPNENYAREIMELHTLGGGVYLGTVDPGTVAKDITGVAVGFTDQDVVQASRALSGWTLLRGQAGEGKTTLASTGEFAFNLRQHNRNAGKVLGVNLAALNSADMTQGRKFLDIIAGHPATATFIVTKLAKRMFGDTPPQSVIDRGVAAWKANQTAPNQIAKVLQAMLLDGVEVFTAPVAKVRRPYERIIAVARTAALMVSPATYMTTILDPVSDGLFAWPAPNGRPDSNGYWLATGSTVATWNLIAQLMFLKEFAGGSLTGQVPLDAIQSATAIVEYWVDRIVGSTLHSAAMTTLIADQATGNGVPAAVKGKNAQKIENAHRRLVSLIATSQEFTLR